MALMAFTTCLCLYSGVKKLRYPNASMVREA